MMDDEPRDTRTEDEGSPSYNLLMDKIKKQQKELELSHDTCERQARQIKELMNQLFREDLETGSKDKNIESQEIINYRIKMPQLEAELNKTREDNKALEQKVQDFHIKAQLNFDLKSEIQKMTLEIKERNRTIECLHQQYDYQKQQKELLAQEIAETVIEKQKLKERVDFLENTRPVASSRPSEGSIAVTSSLLLSAPVPVHDPVEDMAPSHVKVIGVAEDYNSHDSTSTMTNQLNDMEALASDNVQGQSRESLECENRLRKLSLLHEELQRKYHNEKNRNKSLTEQIQNLMQEKIEQFNSMDEASLGWMDERSKRHLENVEAEKNMLLEEIRVKEYTEEVLRADLSSKAEIIAQLLRRENAL